MDANALDSELALQAVNQRLADLLRTDPLPLETGGARSLGDALWVWGIVGGKDVGKSTLINALAGADVVDRGEDVGEGTYAPGTYLCDADLPAARSRFEGLDGVEIRFHDTAPESMRGLVLVDLPDFDSLFSGHVETVRRIAGVLDGIIWVTTPKKVGDLKAIEEIRRVLKARVNFCYVVNKMDWLLAQSAESPEQELARSNEALRRQVSECDTEGAAQRSFLVAARYGTSESMLAAIAHSRNAERSEMNGVMARAVDTLLGNFASLRQRLTTAPTAEVAAANKRANLAFQVRTQASQVSAHYRPHEALDRLERAVKPEAIGELAERYFSRSYCDGVLRQLNDERRLFAEWSGALFRRRIACWPLLGVIAWPLMTLGAALGGLRAALPRVGFAGDADPYRLDGVDLEQRTDGLIDGVRARLGRWIERLSIELPSSPALQQQWRGDVQMLAQQQRSAVIDRYLERRPGWVGRCLRGVLPLAILLWFPLAQPLLSALLGGDAGTLGANLATVRSVVQAMSGGSVLAGLSVALLLLGLLAALAYSRTVRDTYAALGKLRDASVESASGAIRDALIDSVTRPIHGLREELSALTERLESLGK